MVVGYHINPGTTVGRAWMSRGAQRMDPFDKLRAGAKVHPYVRPQMAAGYGREHGKHRSREERRDIPPSKDRKSLQTEHPDRRSLDSVVPPHVRSLMGRGRAYACDDAGTMFGTASRAWGGTRKTGWRSRPGDRMSRLWFPRPTVASQYPSGPRGGDYADCSPQSSARRMQSSVARAMS
jgi:hypothetical protein